MERLVLDVTFARPQPDKPTVHRYVRGIWVVVKIMVPFWVPEILGAVLYSGSKKGTIIFTTTHMILVQLYSKGGTIIIVVMEVPIVQAGLLRLACSASMCQNLWARGAG